MGTTATSRRHTEHRGLRSSAVLASRGFEHPCFGGRKPESSANMPAPTCVVPCSTGAIRTEPGAKRQTKSGEVRRSFTGMQQEPAKKIGRNPNAGYRVCLLKLPAFQGDSAAGGRLAKRAAACSKQSCDAHEVACGAQRRSHRQLGAGPIKSCKAQRGRGPVARVRSPVLGRELPRRHDENEIRNPGRPPAGTQK